MENALSNFSSLEKNKPTCIQTQITMTCTLCTLCLLQYVFYHAGLPMFLFVSLTSLRSKSHRHGSVGKINDIIGGRQRVHVDRAGSPGARQVAGHAVNAGVVGGTTGVARVR